MQRIARSLPLLVVIFVFALALPQFAFAQRLKPIPHPIGVMQHPATQAATQAVLRHMRRFALPLPPRRPRRGHRLRTSRISSSMAHRFQFSSPTVPF